MPDGVDNASPRNRDNCSINTINVADRVLDGLPLSGAALALISVAITLLSLGLAVGIVLFTYLCWLDPHKAYTAVTTLLIPLFFLLIHQKSKIEKALYNYRNTVIKLPIDADNQSP